MREPNSPKTGMVGEYAAILAEFGVTLDSSSCVLDYGCGAGSNVAAYREAGFKAYGCDVVLTKPDECLRLMDSESFRIPFADETFDFVFSNSVFEHVSNHAVTARELSRVMKPGACSLHNFPSKWRFIEPHVHVPMATIFRPYWWLWVWAHLGVRNPHQRELDAPSVAQVNYDYLGKHTNYLSRREIIGKFNPYFAEVKFVERMQFLHGSGGPAGLPVPRNCCPSCRPFMEYYVRISSW